MDVEEVKVITDNDGKLRREIKLEVRREIKLEVRRQINKSKDKQDENSAPPIAFIVIIAIIIYTIFVSIIILCTYKYCHDKFVG